MPKSYLASEPGCQRAEAHGFDPYAQTWSRLAAYRAMGHPTDKVELIVLGGTWSHYPEAYQRWFLLRCLAALCDFGSAQPEASAQRLPPGVEAPARSPRRQRGTYNALVARRLRQENGGRLQAASEQASWEALEERQRANEAASSRCVGLSLETRPDCIDAAEVLRLRRLGATKIQLGIQSLSDPVLSASRRGHDAAASRSAMSRLRAAGFKLHAHWMPNLPGATPASDREDFARLFQDPAVLPDELKIYPCSLLETAELMDHYRAGRWRPYDEEVLVELLEDCLAAVPPWCRVSRVIRDIPSPEILAGSRTTNLREVVERRIREQGWPLREIRSREVRAGPVDPAGVELVARSYRSRVGSEIFLEGRLPDARLAGFLRLTLPARGAGPEEIRSSALLREVHVYGPAAALGESRLGEAQHQGLGTRLVERAAHLAAGAGFRDLAVISAVGTRPWYRRLGFRDGPLYQHRSL